MKVLLDENLPKRLKQDFPEHEFFTVRDQQWQGKKNGELLREMLAAGFHGLVTFDKNLRYQQNFSKYPIAVVLLNAPDNTYLTLQQLVPPLRHLLQQPLPPGPHIVSL
ncbi:hypothetical protein [Hymenobacter chitinivorans]|uniref:VapC45 PIN like domain-containing protein n=1 Tax=Hymenobacter chitinivorans DSM 11115 TaxID=1121954 RepID=A0A2M9B5P0_9BACT|nr:hypothetical protein [Hymenobacter chitinivorans]PJJ53250.1 hypothetical protein CLV45_3910 [Hymenobacter chitinivorans DSM 11115]